MSKKTQRGITPGNHTFEQDPQIRRRLRGMPVFIVAESSRKEGETVTFGNGMFVAVDGTSGKRFGRYATHIRNLED